MDQPSVADEVFEQGGQVIKNTANAVKNAPANLAKAAVGQVAPALTPSESSPDHPVNPPAKSFKKIFKNQILKPTPEQQAKEDQKMIQVRQELHSAYYQRLVNPPRQQEEGAAERVEKIEKAEEQQKFEMAQKKQNSEQEVRNAQARTTEHLKGVGG